MGEETEEQKGKEGRKIKRKGSKENKQGERNI
jgi:hypothetical protein